MIIHEEIVNQELCKYYSSLKGNGELENDNSIVTLLRKPLLCKYRDRTVLPLSRKEMKEKELQRIYELADMFR